jgi:hypothetical protein
VERGAGFSVDQNVPDSPGGSRFILSGPVEPGPEASTHHPEAEQPNMNWQRAQSAQPPVPQQLLQHQAALNQAALYSRSPGRRQHTHAGIGGVAQNQQRMLVPPHMQIQQAAARPPHAHQFAMPAPRATGTTAEHQSAQQAQPARIAQQLPILQQQRVQQPLPQQSRDAQQAQVQHDQQEQAQQQPQRQHLQPQTQPQACELISSRAEVATPSLQPPREQPDHAAAATIAADAVPYPREEDGGVPVPVESAPDGAEGAKKPAGRSGRGGRGVRGSRGGSKGAARRSTRGSAAVAAAQEEPPASQPTAGSYDLQFFLDVIRIVISLH